MDLVSPVTAYRLKDAGFPAPKLNVGQHWVGLVGNSVTLLLDKATEGEEAFIDRHGNYHLPSAIYYWGTFVPTTLELLGQLNNNLPIGRWWALIPPLSDGLWECSFFYGWEDKILSGYHKNPAEACANAYFEMVKFNKLVKFDEILKDLILRVNDEKGIEEG